MVPGVTKIITLPFKEIAYYKNAMFNPLRFRIKKFEPKIKLYINKRNYIIKTAENYSDLKAVLKLRFRVFYNELLKKRLLWGIDIDKYDFICDHLMIIDKACNTCVGTYRLNSSAYSDTFYSESEFDISNIKNISDSKLELGRACIDPFSRNGMVIALLWKGIYDYIKASESRYLFGLTSIKSTDPQIIANLSYYLDQYRPDSEIFDVFPKKKFILKKHSNFYSKLKSDPGLLLVSKAKELIPPLLKGYLRHGAYICGDPALDRAFRCVDYFTILDVEKLPASISKRLE